MGKIVQTAGRNTLGEFAPEFAHFNDDVLFGENWNNQDIDVKTRSIITVVALMASGITDSSLKYHLQNAKNHGVTQKEIAAVITHAAFYAGWPKAWAVFNLAKEVWEQAKEICHTKRKRCVRMHPMWVGIIMGTLTGAAGGMLRDVLLNEVPLIFRKDIYAIACICGGLIYYLCMYLDLPAAPTQFIAACSVILIRILAVRYGISLPALKGETRPAPKEK